MSDISSTTDFNALGLISPLVSQLKLLNYTKPTQIQSAVIAPLLKGVDLQARANTGSGKTAAFALPLLQLLCQKNNNESKRSANTIFSLVLLPTRELAAQVGQRIKDYGALLQPHIKVVTAIGGVSINPQMQSLRGGADILVATPGRLLDLVAHNAIKLNRVKHLVLDEADRLLGLGFNQELTALLNQLPKDKQTVLFSATFDQEVNELIEQLLKNPLKIDLLPEQDKVDIEQRVFEVSKERKTALLINLLKTNDWSQVLVFANAKVSCNRLLQKLDKAGIPAEVFHGDKSQGNRSSVLNKFKTGGSRVLIATDIAARGLDIDNLPAVINYELPRSPLDYVHRIGRTGRAGKQGTAISLINPDEFHHFHIIEKKNKFKLTREQYAGFEVVI